MSAHLRAKALAAVGIGAAFMTLASGVHAQTVDLSVPTGFAGLPNADLPTLVGRIIYAFLGLLGIVAVVLVIYAGFLWMTAQGNDDKIKQAKKILVNATIGIVIIFASWGIVAFVLNALDDGLGGGGGVTSSGSGGPAGTLYGANRGAEQLGNGVIEYHFPEPGQNDVARNTKVSITFKKPLVLSTVFRGYDDKGTYSTADDTVGGAPVTAQTNLLLNTDNVRLIAVASLAQAGAGAVDEQFNVRHPIDAAVEASARVTVVNDPMTAGQAQTLVIKPVAPIGSGTADVNYRVALRGGDAGVRVWTLPPTGGTPTAGAAFARTYADGGYFWSFTTGTVIDTVPPKIVAVEPVTVPVPGTPAGSVLDRNQLLQVYFSEPIDPTSASLEVTAVCDSALGTCTFNNGQSGTVAGTAAVGNRNQTVEFTPSLACEGVSANSCGEKVFCLPRNARLTVRALAATVGNDGPTAVVSNGIVDMADNSLDGNGDGTAQGPQSPAQPNGRAADYYRNSPQSDLSGVSDTARWEYLVGSNVDLVPPHITKMDPPPPPEFSASYPNGPSNVPPSLVPTITWSKTMSISSLRTGSFDELQSRYSPDTASVVLRARECAKTSREACPAPPAKCDCTRLDPPGFFIDAGAPVQGNGNTFTEMRFMHPGRPFYRADDLGYTEQDILNHPENVPQYVPVARAQVKDTKQNCFYPSQFVECTRTASGQTSCCNRTASPDDGFVSNCAP